MSLSSPDHLARCLVEATVRKTPAQFDAAAGPQDLDAAALAHFDRHGLVALAVHTLAAAGRLHADAIADRTQPRPRAPGHRPQAPIPAVFCERARRLAARRVLLEAMLGGLGERLAAGGIPAATTRAFGRVAALYPAPECRPTSDIDLVVPCDRFADVAAVLGAEGFALVQADRPDLWRQSGVTLDLAFRPSAVFEVTGVAAEAAGFAALNRAWTTILSESRVSGVGVFPLPLEFLLCALHYGYKHRFARHLWGLDLLLLGAAMDEADVRALLDLARRARSEHLLAHAMRRAEALAGDAHPAALRGRLPDADPSRVRAFLIQRRPGGAGGKDAGLLLAVICAPGFRARFRLVWHMLRRLPRGRGLGAYLKRYLAMPVRVLGALLRPGRTG